MLDAAAAPTKEAIQATFGSLRPLPRVEHLRLVPTPRSLLTGQTAPCAAVTEELAATTTELGDDG
jgi:hypothetical protein